MAGAQRPLGNHPESRVLGIKSEPEIVNVFVGGAHGVGKTALITQYILHHFVDSYDPTGEEYRCQRVFNETPYILEFLEMLASWVLEEMPALMNWLKGVDVLLFAYDVGDRGSFVKMKDIYQKVLAILDGVVNVPVCIVATKSDTPKEKWQVEAEEGREFASRLGGVFVACSAKDGDGVEDAVERPVTVFVERRMELLRQREERHQERMRRYQERARKSEPTATVMEKVRRWLPFGKR